MVSPSQGPPQPLLPASSVGKHIDDARCVRARLSDSGRQREQTPSPIYLCISSSVGFSNHSHVGISNRHMHGVGYSNPRAQCWVLQPLLITSYNSRVAVSHATLSNFEKVKREGGPLSEKIHTALSPPSCDRGRRQFLVRAPTFPFRISCLCTGYGSPHCLVGGTPLPALWGPEIQTAMHELSKPQAWYVNPTRRGPDPSLKD